MLEPPNTEENYLLKEMGFRIARKHRLGCAVARLTAFVVPLLATLAASSSRRACSPPPARC